MFDTNRFDTDDEYEFTDDLGESIGYSDFDWDDLPEGEEARHDEIIEMSLEDVRGLDLARASDLLVWAAAQVFADEEEDAEFERLALRIVSSPAPHPALDYAEIALELANDFLVEERYDDLESLLPHIERLVRDDATLTERFAALVALGKGKVEPAMRRIQKLADDNTNDPYLLAALGEDLISCGYYDEALALLDRAESLASAEHERDLESEVSAAIALAKEMRDSFGGKSR